MSGFDLGRLQPGAYLGQREMLLEPALFEQWFELFPEDRRGTRMPQGYATIIDVITYSKLTAGRPPGAVHVQQDCSLVRLPDVGDKVVTTLHCGGTEIRKDRRWVTLDMETKDERGELLWRGRMITAWPLEVPAHG